MATSQAIFAFRAKIPLFNSGSTQLSDADVGSALDQAAVSSARLCFALDPFVQPVPDTHQTFVRDVDDRCRAHLLRSRRHQEGTARFAKDVEYGLDFLRACVGNGA